jgi:hypothetical protein
MHQDIGISISGKFPDCKIKFSEDPTPVPRKARATFTFALQSKGFRIVDINMQREPFETQSELTWSIPADQQSVTLLDRNKDRLRSAFAVEIVFEDAAGNRFSSQDPQVENEGLPPP